MQKIQTTTADDKQKGISMGCKKRGLLVLGRRVGEAIMIGDDIRIEIVGIKGGQIPQVHIGFAAPRDVQIVRSELVGTEPRPKPGHQR